MAKQTLTFVALPNGNAGQGQIGLSIYMAPRLDKGATLALFPDILNWTQLVHDQGLQFTLTCNGQTTTAAIDPSVLRPEIWHEIFLPETLVAPYRIPDYTQQLLVSYPVRDAMSFVKFAYQAVSLQTQGEKEQRLLHMLLRDLMFRDGQVSTLDAALSQLRVEMWREQHDMKGRGSATNIPFTRGLGAPTSTQVPPDGIPTTRTEPPETRQMISRFALYHNIPPAPGRAPLPQSKADFAKVLDFHQALTALNSYPSLMRALGLVFDLNIPEAFCPYSPSAPGGPYLTIAVEGVAPNFKWSHPPTYFFPETSYFRSGTSYTAAPVTPSGNLGTQNYVVGDVIDGMLALLPAYFHLTEIDIDGALLKAMSLADNVANARPSLEIDQVLPSLRSSGIALIANGRALQLLRSFLANQEFDAALQSNSPLPQPFNARDLVRGYRIDVWSSRTNHWHSLHRRNGTYRFGHQAALVLNSTDEEGFTQLAAAQPADDPTRPADPVATQNKIPQPGTDIFVHERVAAWTGWSLSVQRPGGAMNRSPDPALAADPDPTLNDPITPFKMVATFDPVPRSLPELRFGARYRMRARAVDLAGNSVPVDHESTSDMVLPINAELPYLRFEPVPHPLLLLRDPLGPGASLERLVIRTYNDDPSLDLVPTGEVDQRHLAPPQASVRMSEQHGMLDDQHGHLRGDQATYDMIVARDKGVFKSQGNVPIDPRPRIAVPYLPDPIARGAALQNLPNTSDDMRGEVVQGHLRYSTLPDVQVRPGSVTHIDFGLAWPQRQPFRMVVAEGQSSPHWDETGRALTVYVPKAGMTNVLMSCYLNDRDLSLMGIWNWLREFLEAQEADSMQNASASELVPWTTDSFALLTRWVLDGGHPMLTPGRTLTLVHAVQQPIGHPEFILLPVVHQSGQPVSASALRNGFSPITAWRTLHSHHAFLLGGLRIHGKSTTQIDIQAQWREFVDEPADPMPVIKPASGHVDTIDVSSLDAGPIAADQISGRYVADYIPQVDTLWFAAPFDALPGVSSPWAISAPMHRFSDTKHREVYYEAVATSRFREYFADQTLKFTRTSERLLVDVPSSARPVAPEIAYVVPTFGFERQESTNVKTDVRFGNGVRVYIQRPWYSSGEGELLGVILWAQSSQPPNSDDREKYKHQISQWGLDPIWQTGSLTEIPATYQFPNAVGHAEDLTLEESSLLVDVAGHDVGFDRERKMWYCDITFSASSAYSPFVRLAFARYQPRSIPGAELSHVVLADFAQLSPDRSAVVSVDPSDPRTARVFVGGLAPIGPNRSFFTVSVERRLGKVESDLAWEAAPPGMVSVVEDAPAPGQPDAVLWSGSVVFSSQPKAGLFRVVVREYEVVPRDPSLIEIETGSPALGQRIVYAAIIPYDFPSNPTK